MIALDTNILVYAQREDSEHHQRALAVLRGLVQGRRRWAVPWPCLHELFAIVTHPRIYRPPTEPTEALRALAELSTMPGSTVIGEADDHLTVLGRLVERSGIRGPRVHDARIAAICLSHGVSELWSADRDFSFFPELVTRNPLVD